MFGSLNGSFGELPSTRAALELPFLVEAHCAHQACAGHVASRGGKCGLSNKPVFPQSPCCSQQHGHSAEPEAHASGACLLHTSTVGPSRCRKPLFLARAAPHPPFSIAYVRLGVVAEEERRRIQLSRANHVAFLAVVTT